MAQREGKDHVHSEYWGKADHFRFEDRVNNELQEVERAVDRLTHRITLLMGGLALVAFLVPVAAPFIRIWLGLSGSP